MTPHGTFNLSFDRLTEVVPFFIGKKKMQQDVLSIWSGLEKICCVFASSRNFGQLDAILLLLRLCLPSYSTEIIGSCWKDLKKK